MIKAVQYQGTDINDLDIIQDGQGVIIKSKIACYQFKPIEEFPITKTRILSGLIEEIFDYKQEIENTLYDIETVIKSIQKLIKEMEQ